MTRRVLAVEFESLAVAQACYKGPDYAEAMIYALRASRRQLLIIKGEIAG